MVLDGVLTVLYLIFTEGYGMHAADLCDEALRLSRLLAVLMPDEPEVLGLCALIALQHSRSDARTDDGGGLVLLADQDRDRWHHDEIADALALLRSIDNGPGPSSTLGRGYHLQALVAVEHATAARPEDTRWDRIATLYAGLETLTPSPAVRVASSPGASSSSGHRR